MISGIVTEVASAVRFIWGGGGGQHWDKNSLEKSVQEVYCSFNSGIFKESRRVTLPQVNGNVSTGRDQTVSARTVRPQLHSERIF